MSHDICLINLLVQTCTRMPLLRLRSSPLKLYDFDGTWLQGPCSQECQRYPERFPLSTLLRYRSQWSSGSLNVKPVRTEEKFKDLPSASMTRFSGLMSRWIIFFSWMYSRPATRHATKKPTWRRWIIFEIVVCLLLTSSLFVKATIPADVVPQVAAREVVHHQVEVLTILECIVHVDNEQVLELGKDLSLVDDWLDGPLGNNARLGHLLHGVVLLRFLALHAPHLSEATLADAEVIHKVCLWDSCTQKRDKNKVRWVNLAVTLTF